MDEENYRQIYEQINGAPCVFEKGILSLKCQCAYQHIFRLADRHGVGCTDTVMQLNCKAFLDHLRKQTRFVFKIDIDGPLPHNKEIKVQNGGMLGVQKLLLDDSSAENVEDIAGLMMKAIEVYGGIEALPYNLIMPSVTNYKTRPKRQPKKE
ncbi:MAG: hypothetical protein OQK46_00290 [Gammaproteobacteria bacterium]|nr:hypothetical protein [Gammaproteobacteria bacterium]